MLRNFIIILVALALCGADVENVTETEETTTETVTLTTQPEIAIKLENGTLVEIFEGKVLLPKSLKRVELICNASYPVQWRYYVNNKRIGSLDYVRYERELEDLADAENGNIFTATVTLRGLLESQTGRYKCEQLDLSEEISTYEGNDTISEVQSQVDLFIPGGKGFNAGTQTVYFVNESATEILVECPVTDYTFSVQLFKLQPDSEKSTSMSWKPVDSSMYSYDPTEGFTLSGKLEDMLGVYRCSASNGATIMRKFLLESKNPDKHQDSSQKKMTNCWEDFDFVRYWRAKRLEEHCGKGSRCSFIRTVPFPHTYQKTFDEPEPENEEKLQLKECNDWRLDEFMKNGEESGDICFRDETVYNSKTKLTATGTIYPDGYGDISFAHTKLQVTYYGSDEQPTNVVLQVKRGNFSEDWVEFEEFVDVEPEKHFYPLSHNVAMWKDLIVNGTNVEYIVVYQPTSDYPVLQESIKPELATYRTFWQKITDFFG